MFHPVADSLRLERHAQVDQRFEILGQSERVEHLTNHQRVSAGVFLVHFHDIGCHVPVGFIRVGADGLQRRERLKTELAHKTRILVAIRGERLAPVPDIPIMGVALNLSIWIFKRGIRRRRTGPISMFGVFGGAPFGQGVMKKLVVGGSQTLQFRVFPIPIHPTPLHLVVAAPQRKAGAVAQAADIFNHFHVDIFQKFLRVQRIDTARENKLLPNQNAVAVAKIVKTFFLIKAAAPNAQHILVRLNRRANETFEIFIRNSRGEGIGGNPIGAFGKNLYPVDDKREGASPFIGLLAQFNRAKSQLIFALIQQDV